MEHNPVVLRMSITLVALTCSILAALDLAGLTPNPSDDAIEARLHLMDALALPATIAAENQDYGGLRTAFDIAIDRNEELLSAGLRDGGGRLLMATREHRRLWQPEGDRSTATHARLPLYRRGERWGELEMRFDALSPGGIFAQIWARPGLRLLLLVAGFGFVAYGLYMRRALRFLDPSAVIPPRVQAVLDVMAEGVLLLDRDERIVLANTEFARRIGTKRSSLMGRKASELGWLVPNTTTPASELPWQKAIQDAETHQGISLRIGTGADSHTFIVSGAPVVDGSGRVQGAIATFDDVTELEHKTDALQHKSSDLEQALTELHKSREEIRMRNEELQILATSDPLTGVANRRAFMERLEKEFAKAHAEGRPLCCVMADIDHFKKVNDVHGHAVGDAVIRSMSKALKEEFADRELVCRYGGEEFVMLLIDERLESGVRAAERVRKVIEVPGFADVDITASFGVSSTELGARHPQELIEQADQALYVSKDSGRNRVTSWRKVASKAK